MHHTLDTPHRPALTTRRSRAGALTLPLVLLVGVLAALVGIAPGPATARTTSTTASTASPTTGPTASAPSECATSGTYVWSHLHACGWPSGGTTGPQAKNCPGGTLTPRGDNNQSVIHLRTAGALVSCQQIKGCLSVEAPNVVIRDVAVQCTSGRTGEDANGTAVISVTHGASAKIVRTATDGLRGVHACVWHMGTALEVNRLDCKHVNDGVFSWASSGDSSEGDHFTVLNSYLHSFTTRTANGHIDGYQTEGASHGLIRHNTLLMTSDDNNSSDSAIAIWDGQKSSSDILVKHNLIAGGGFSVYAHDYSPSDSNPSGGFSVTDVRFVDNVFSKRLFGCVGQWGVWFTRGQPTDGWHRSGNEVLETQADIDDQNPENGGQVCS
ncbi:hypothetical protein FB382_003333 [Nocardioides ginsengisegetis]|uniref:Right handed beta helix region n=1 Tax=Nocardioides ginsengisegetis TaxID=661491 RepID=A0A7W3J2J0_9ACTN|nr:hypothetical protein [Nocardioides ginsengisegetis]MBA8805042.1 hypothetical protein [Nocardioides ginsengisegetis]